MKQRLTGIFEAAVWTTGRQLSVACFLLVCLLVLSGCSSIDSQPFQQFSQAVEQSTQTVDNVLRFNQQWAQKDFIKNFPRQDGARLSQLKLSDNAHEGARMKLKPRPLFMTIAQSRNTMQRLNRAFERYIHLLVALSELDLVKSGDIRQLSTAINRLGSDIIKTSDSRLPSGEIKLLSQAATQAMLLYLKHRRRSDLQRAVTANQGNVSRYAAAASDILRVTAAQLKVYYSEQAGELIRQWRKGNYHTRVKLVRDMLKLNLSYAGTLETIAALQQFYHTLPPAHAALAGSITRPTSGAEALLKLKTQADALKRLNKKLRHFLSSRSR